MIQSFTIPGEPIGKGRPRFTRGGATYTPPRTRDYESRVQACYDTEFYLNKWQMFPKGVGLCVEIEAYFKPPKATPKKTIWQMIAGIFKPCKRPDADNIAKAVCDALNGHCYPDDSQVTALLVFKRYGNESEVKVTVSNDERKWISS